MQVLINEPKRDTTVKNEKWYCYLEAKRDGIIITSKIHYGSTAEIARKRAERYAEKLRSNPPKPVKIDATLTDWDLPF